MQMSRMAVLAVMSAVFSLMAGGVADAQPPNWSTASLSQPRVDPAVSSEIDWEVELAVIIGKRGKNIRAGDALSYVFGYTVLNDITARDIQRREMRRAETAPRAAPTCPVEE